MDEGEILEMGRKLIEKHMELENEKKTMDLKIAQIQKKLCMIYTFGRELDMLIEEDSNFPLVIKYMVERIRGITSSMLFYDPDDDNTITINLNI